MNGPKHREREEGTVLVLGHYTIIYTVYQPGPVTMPTIVRKNSSDSPNGIRILLQSGASANNSLQSPVYANGEDRWNKIFR